MSGSFALFALRRSVAAVGVAIAVTALTFLTLHGLAPENFNDTHPLPIEMLHYLERVFLHADLGLSSFRPFQPVLTMLGESVPADLSMLVGAMVLGVLGGIAGGVLCARRPGSLLSRLLQIAAAVLLCAPVYVTGMMAILLFAPAVGPVLPIGLVTINSYVGLTADPVGWLHAMFVPWLIAAAPLAAMCLRMTRATLPEVMEAEFVRTAHGKGLRPQRVTMRHALPVALPPTLSLAGAYTPILLGNVVLVEAVFGIPGIYRLIPGSISNGNFPVLQGIVVVGAVFVVIANALVDLALAALDPRVRAS